MNLLKRQLSVANVLSCVALFVALSGAAYAATTIGKKSVKARHLANGSVTAPKIRREAVTTPKIRNAAVISTKIATGAVGTLQIADGSVRSSKLGGSVVTSGKLKDGGVTGPKLANNAVTASKIANDAVTTSKIQEGAVTAAKLATSFNAQLLKNVTYATATSQSNTSEPTKTATAFCPTGKQVIGGGGKVIGGDVVIVITESAPTPINADSKRIGWSAVGREIAASTVNWSVEAYAVCAEF